MALLCLLTGAIGALLTSTVATASSNGQALKAATKPTIGVQPTLTPVPVGPTPGGAEHLTISVIDGRSWPTVTLNMTLLGPDGKAVPDLTLSQFEVQEENKAQAPGALLLGQARTVPLAIVLAIDVSGSMNGDKLDKAKEAAKAFINTLGPKDQAALIAFNAAVSTVVPFTGDHGALETGVTSLHAAGNTAAFDALYSSVQLLVGASGGSGGASEVQRAVILLSDGQDTSSKHSNTVAADVARQEGVLVYTVGLGADADDTMLKSLSAPSGGKYYKAPQPSDLQGAYNAISIELNSQFLLKYTSTTMVARSYEFTTVQIKYTSKSGQIITATTRYRPPLAALIPSTPEVSVVPTPYFIALPPSVIDRSENDPQTTSSVAPVFTATAALITLLGSLLVALAVIALMAALAVKLSPSPAAQRLARYGGDPAALLMTISERAPGFGSRVLLPMMAAIGGGLGRLSPGSYTKQIEELLILKGPPYRLQIGSFLGIQLVLTLALFVPVVLWAVSSPHAPAQVILAALLALVLGIYLPYSWLTRKVRARKAAMLKALPSALDFLAINVEAGTGFDAALTEVVKRWHNALTTEFALLLIDFQIGKPRKEAWRDLVARTQVPDLNSFVTAMLQSEQVGSSVGALLKTQAEYMRIRRRQRAEETARVAPVKMLLPMVFFIFPGILVVLLGPAIPQFLDTFGTLGR